MTVINAINQMGYSQGNKEEEQQIIRLSSTNSEKVCWTTTMVEATVIVIGNIRLYLGTTPPAFTTLPDL